MRKSESKKTEDSGVRDGEKKQTMLTKKEEKPH